MVIIIALLASFFGFCIALYIYGKQYAKKPLMCPRKSPCETVISSPQANTFGISNTVLGMVYYVVVFFFFLYIRTGIHSALEVLTLGMIITAGFLFSVYLVGVQQYKIKQWCVWCLGSAAMATIIFLCMLKLFF